MVVPVGVAAVLVEYHIVDELVDVEQAFDAVYALIACQGAELGIGGEPSVVGDYAVALGLVDLDDFVVRQLAAEMGLAEIFVDLLGEAVDAPVHSVEEDVDVAAGAAWHSQAGAGAAGPHITHVLRLAAVAFHPVLPGVAEEGAQDQRVEFSRAAVAEDFRVELVRSVGILELQLESVLGVFLGQAGVSAVDLDATVDGNIEAAAEHLKRYGALPVAAGPVSHRRSGMDVDASGGGISGVVEEIALVGDYRHDGNLPEAGFHLLAQLRVAGHHGIHRIVGLGAAFDFDVGAPFRRVSLGSLGQVEYVVVEEVAGGGSV